MKSSSFFPRHPSTTLFKEKRCRSNATVVKSVVCIILALPYSNPVTGWVHPSCLPRTRQISISSTDSFTTVRRFASSIETLPADQPVWNDTTTSNSKQRNSDDLENEKTDYSSCNNNKNEVTTANINLNKLQGKLLKKTREVCKEYQMLEDGDHIMVCVSGGKDSATLLYLFNQMQQRLLPQIKFQLTAVHVDQKQPGYNGTSLVKWLEDDMKIPYRIVEEDTYSIVVDKTAPNKSYCTVCSRLRRGILYTTAMELGCNKIALGHHADDALETLLLNMLHAGQMKSMPARYQSKRGNLAVMRPLIRLMEKDIATYAELQKFPILPCNLCSNQANLQRPQVKLLLKTLTHLNPNAKENMLHSIGDIRPSHLLDQNLRLACGMDPITGEEEENAEESLPF